MTSNTEEHAQAEATASAKEPTATNKATLASPARRVAPGKRKSGRKATPAKKGVQGAKAAKSIKKAGAREGSKTAKILDLLKRPGGATIKQLMKETDWQPHSVRGFLSATLGKKMKLTITSTKNQDGERSYAVKN